MRQRELSVFLSHTSELWEYPEPRSFVAAAKDAVLGFTGLPVQMKDFPARDQYPAALCRERVAACSFYVGIIGFRYGTVVKDDPERSYVELEYYTAKDKGLTRLLFLLDSKAAGLGIPPDEIYDDEENGEKRRRQREFRKRLQEEEGLTLKLVKTPEELAEQLTLSLHSELMAQQDPGQSEDRSIADSAASPLVLASMAQRQLQSVRTVLESAIREVERVEHSYAEPATIDTWRNLDDVVQRHNELAGSAAASSAALNISLENVSRETETATKIVEKLVDEWPSRDALELTSIMDMMPELQRISGVLLERIEAARAELRKRAAYSPGYGKPRDALSQAGNLIAGANASMFRMRGALSRSQIGPEAGRAASSPPPRERPNRTVPSAPASETTDRQVRYVDPPPEYSDTGLQAAAGGGVPPLAEDASPPPVPSDRIPVSGVAAFRVRGDSMLGAEIRDGDDVIVRLQQVAEDNEIVVISIWESGDPDYGKTSVKRYRRQGGEPRLVSEYADRHEDEPFQANRHRLIGKVIGVFRSVP
jgi:phage repressor protein C with HTH and peptisase S24 domain